MSPLVVYSSRVFQYKSKHSWKETWLSLEKNGTLSWKRKDGYQVKGTIYVPDVLHQIKLETPDEKHLDNRGTPFFMSVPIKVDQNNKYHLKKFAVMSGQDLGLWLDAFATVVNEWKIFKQIRERHMEDLAQTKEISPEILETKLAYQELVYYFKEIWEDFVRQHINGKPLKKALSNGTYFISPLLRTRVFA